MREKLLGQQVTLEGTAKDAKGGAVLITAENNVIYLKGIHSWSDDLIDKLVSVSGVLKEEKYIPDPVVAKDGAISQGAEGNQLVLENVKINP